MRILILLAGCSLINDKVYDPNSDLSITDLAMCTNCGDLPVAIDGGDAGTDMAKCSSSAQCDDTTPICGATMCRTCMAGDDAECALHNAATPRCDTATGQCVACLAATVNVDCVDPAKPICSANVCAACASSADDAQCAAHADGRPRCDSASGQCVACRTDTQASDCMTKTSPICDAAHVCRVCKAHSECSGFGNWPEGDPTSGVCAQSGACAIPAQVLFVDNRAQTKAACDAAHTTHDGTLADPHCDISEVFPSPSPIALVRGSAQPYDVLNIPNSANLTIAIVGPGFTVPSPATITPSANNVPAVTLTTDTVHSLDVTLDGVVVAGAGSTNGYGIVCTGTVTTSLTKVRLLRAAVQGNSQIGVTGTNCDVTIDQTIIGPTKTANGNASGGVSLSSCTYSITNTLVQNNGTGTSSIGGISISGTGNAANRIVNTTIADNTNTGAVAAGLLCLDNPLPTVFNIVANNNTNADVAGCMPSTSAFKDGSGTNQNTTGCFSDDLFKTPTAPAYDYSPQVPAGGAGTCTVSLVNVGTKTGAPDHDLLASPRPLPAGSSPDVGAYEVP